MATDTILETRGLTKEFKGFVAVNGVDLAVTRGTIHALIGPNGAGKTTCFNLLTHFLTPTRGQIIFNGREITGHATCGHRADGPRALVPDLRGISRTSRCSKTCASRLQRKRGHSFDFWRSRARAARASTRARAS